MKYLITGGAGFIGSHLTEYLANSNQIIVVDDLSSGFEKNLPKSQNIELIKEKIQNVNINQLADVKGIFHLAAQASVPKSITDFFNSSSNNLLGTLKVFDIANKLNIPIVYATSSAVYGNLPVGDDTIESYDILSPYAQDKLTMEHYAKVAWNVYRTKSIGLRFFNVYGPRQDPSNPYSGVISIFIDRLLNNSTVTVNGGYQTRDFIFVNNIVDVMIRSMNIVINNDICEVVNVGTKKSITIDTLLLTLIDILKAEPKVIRAELPEGDPERSEGTYEKLEKILCISTKKFTKIADGLKSTINYYKENN